jgi:hypothetical protein
LHFTFSMDAAIVPNSEYKPLRIQDNLSLKLQNESFHREELGRSWWSRQTKFPER